MPSSNKKEVLEDFLDEDPEIPSQKYVLLSFISPENILPKKDHYFFQNFLKYYEVQWRTKKLEEFIAGQIKNVNNVIEGISDKMEEAGQTEQASELRKGRLTIDTFINDFQAHVKKNTKDIQTSEIENAYKDFLFTYEKKLDDDFHAANEFRTTIRGVKVRGSYATIEEAKVKAKKLQKVDNIHNIALGEVGKWLPWDPSADQFTSQEYADDQLNQLMHKYKENEENKAEMFRESRLKSGAAAPAGFGAVEDTFVTGEAVKDGDEKKDVFDPVFNGGDLALARKAEAAEAADTTA